MTYNDLYVKIRFRQQGCRALTFALARLSCLLYIRLFRHTARSHLPRGDRFICTASNDHI